MALRMICIGIGQILHDELVQFSIGAANIVATCAVRGHPPNNTDHFSKLTDRDHAP
jgi:hypothetical protein